MHRHLAIALITAACMAVTACTDPDPYVPANDQNVVQDVPADVDECPRADGQPCK